MTSCRKDFIFYWKPKHPTTRKVLQRQIDVTDRQIDWLVYELYDLTPSSGRQGGGDPPNRRNGRQVGIVE